jgi:hypothetical protein
MRCNVFSAIALLALSCVCHAANSGAAVTLHSGYFDDFLMIAADAESGQLSGYYNDGKCRLYFQGPLVPRESYQRKDLGETYMLDTIALNDSNRVFSIEMYSRAKGGFSDQVSIEPAGKGPKECRYRISLDRASHVGNSFIAVRVISRRNARLYRLEKINDQLKVVRDRKTTPPKKLSGVWVSKPYSKAYSPAGYVEIQWYEPMGTGHSAYIREQDLFPLLPQNK